MLEVKQCVIPSANHFMSVIFGMRGAFKSYSKSDSFYCNEDTVASLNKEDCDNCSLKYLLCGEMEESGFVLGENDKKLLLNLTRLGTSDRKILRQLPIVLTINAPLTWWKQADKYQIGTVTCAESTMHTITKYPFTVDDFSLDHAGDVDEPEGLGSFLNKFESIYLRDLNYLRDKFLETGEDKYKKLLIELLPESYNQQRTWSLNYEVALSIISQRKDHPLTEWHTLIDYLLENIPLLKEIYEASCYKEDTLKKLKAENKELRAELKELKGETDE